MAVSMRQWFRGASLPLGVLALAVLCTEPAKTQDERKDVAPGSLAEMIDRIDGGIVHIVTQDALGTDTGYGSGFVIDRSGLIATNFHVLENAVKASVRFRDGKKYDLAGVRGFSVRRDLAIAQIKDPPANLEALELASPSALRQGEELVAIGHPAGFKFTVTTGILSAVRKTSELPEEYQQAIDSDPDTEWVQSSAAISSGSSGGPILTRQGKLVGINTWIAEGQNLGFAVHVRHLVELRERLPAKTSPLPMPGLGLFTDMKVAALAREYDQESAHLMQQLQRMELEEQRRQFLIEKHPGGDYAEKALNLARAETDRLTVFESLLAVCKIARDNSEKSSDALAAAIKMLQADHMDNERMGEVAVALVADHRDEVLRLLQRIIDATPHDNVRAVASFAMASALAQAIESDARHAPEIAALLKSIVEKHPNAQYGHWSPGEEIKRDLFSYEHLAVGRPAPNIVGKGLDGAAFELKDHRGQVAIVDFWVDWCPHCREMYPAERRLVEQLQAFPFVLLGVSGDERQTLERLTRQKTTTWKNWHDGPNGAIAKEWNVEAYPCVYLIGPDGVIRYKYSQAPGSHLEAYTQFLVGEAMFKLPRDLLPLGASWKYLDDGSNQGAAWRAPDFDDTRWQTGKSPIGYGTPDAATSLPSNRAQTVYFRSTFDVEDPSKISDVLLEYYFDDGIAIYLNGAEVARKNLSDGAEFDRPAASSKRFHGTSADYAYVEPAKLKRGKNVLAAEVHQAPIGRADLRFDLSLSANVFPLVRSAIEDKNSPRWRKALEIISDIGPPAADFAKDVKSLLSGDDIFSQYYGMGALTQIQPHEPLKWTPPRRESPQQTDERLRIGFSVMHRCWEIVKSPDFSQSDYRSALSDLAVVQALAPTLPSFSVIRSWGEYRQGDFEKSLQTSQRGTFLRFDVSPEEIACQAAAQHRLGKADLAKQSLARCESLAKLPAHSWNPDARSLVREAVALIKQESAPAKDEADAKK